MMLESVLMILADDVKWEQTSDQYRELQGGNIDCRSLYL